MSSCTGASDTTRLRFSEQPLVAQEPDEATSCPLVAGAAGTSVTSSSSTHHIILFYNYRRAGAAPIDDLSAVVAQHKALCSELGLSGRLLIATEGINGTLASSDRSQLDRYTQWLLACPLFSLKETDFKRSTAPADPFPDLFVREVAEIISTGGVIPVPEAGEGGTHLSPEEFHAKLLQHEANVKKKTSNLTTTGAENSETNKKEKDTVLVDIRCHKEYLVGRFKGAEDPNLRTFHEFPKYLEQKADEWKDKTVIMYCTGGVRCEKASLHLKNHGVEDVYQLEGGIHKYLEKYPDGGNWEGKNFVFDKRGYQPTPSINPEQAVAGKCLSCATPFDAITDETTCTVCNDMVIVCHECREKLRGEYHCETHFHLRDCYFTDLSPFSLEELQTQKAALLAGLKDLGEGENGMPLPGSVGPALKKTANKRRTLRNQVAKIDAVLLQKLPTTTEQPEKVMRKKPKHMKQQDKKKKDPVAETGAASGAKE